MEVEVLDRRTAIVRAAYGQVAKLGFEGLRLRQIAEEVGVDHSTLHHHFAGKREIIAAVAEYAIGQFGSEFPAGADPADTLHLYLQHVRRLLADREELFVVTAELELHARRSPATREILQHHETNWRLSLQRLFDSGDSASSWSSAVDVRAAAELVIAAVKGVQLAPETAGLVFGQLEMLLGVNGT